MGLPPPRPIYREDALLRFVVFQHGVCSIHLALSRRTNEPHTCRNPLDDFHFDMGRARHVPFNTLSSLRDRGEPRIDSKSLSGRTCLWRLLGRCCGWLSGSTCVAKQYRRPVSGPMGRGNRGSGGFIFLKIGYRWRAPNETAARLSSSSPYDDLRADPDWCSPQRSN